MSARAALRAATAADHERVDLLFSGYDLGSEAGYGRFLLAQAAAFLPVEAALDAGGAARLLPDWESRRRAALLREDLEALALPVPAPVPPPALAGEPAMLGALYVIEGSRLGGSVLKRALPASAPRAFLAAPQTPGSWRKLLENLDHFLYRSDDLEAAVGAAKSVFQTFEAGGLRYLESGKT